jgi:hypothetical protein
VDTVETVETVETVAAATDAVAEAVLPVAEPDGAAPEPVAAVPSADKRRRPRTPIRFRVDYVGVREVEASDILAAVARAEAMGLNEIVAVTRVG